MVTRVKPKSFGGVDFNKAADEIDCALSDVDYDALIMFVPLMVGADQTKLKADIRVAAVWYVIEAHLREGPKAKEIKAALTRFASQPYPRPEDLDVLSRRLLWEQAEAPPPAFDDGGEPIAWRSPIEQASPDALRQLARAAANKVWPQRGVKPRTQHGLKVLLMAWKEATGRSAFTEVKNGTEFLEFVRQLIRLLRAKGFNVAPTSRRQMVRSMELVR